MSQELYVISLVLSFLALLISATTAWLTLFRRGTIHMTKPAFIAFSYDLIEGKPKAKIFIRSLLYGTNKRGQVIENMFATLRRGETQQTFNVWGYGETNNLSRGSGLFVGETGVSTNHHFNPPADVNFFPFVPGDYEIRIFAALVGHDHPSELSTIRLTIEASARDELKDAATSVFFDWAPDSRKYHAHIRK